MEERKLTHLVVYGDREHFANIAYLTGFDPRFEEALLIFPSSGTPLLVVGNECEAYVGVSPLFQRRKVKERAFPAIFLARSTARSEPDHTRDLCRGGNRRNIESGMLGVEVLL